MSDTSSAPSASEGVLGEPWLPILSDTSRLRRLPVAVAPLLRGWLEAFRYAVEIADLSFRRLVADLARASDIESLSDAETPVIFASSFADAWTFIDALWRLHELLLNPPAGTTRTRRDNKPGGIRRSEFAAAIRGVKALRDGVQHLDTRIAGLTTDGISVWGTLSWIATNDESTIARSCVMIAGAPREKVRYRFLQPVGLTVRLPIDHITLDAHRQPVNLSVAHEQLRATVSQLEESLSFDFGSLPHGPNDLLTCLDIPVRTGE